MKKASFYVLFMLFSTVEVSFAFENEVEGVRAPEAVVIEVRKNIAMSKDDKVYKNYFINGGANFGLVKGKRVDVIRRLPVHDPIKNSSVGDLFVKVGEIEIIHSDARLSVARPLSIDNLADRPILDFEAVMIGDRLDLSSVRDTQQIAEAKMKTQLNAVVLKKVSREVASIVDHEEQVAFEKKMKAKKSAKKAASKRKKSQRK